MMKLVPVEISPKLPPGFLDHKKGIAVKQTPPPSLMFRLPVKKAAPTVKRKSNQSQKARELDQNVTPTKRA
jgi:hypothetical protein